MGDWYAVFDRTYLQTYEPFVDPERTRAEALGAAGLADLAPGAEILDCPFRRLGWRNADHTRQVAPDPSRTLIRMD
jgi:hypothetical protein